MTAVADALDAGLAGHAADPGPRAAAEPARLPAPARDPGPRGRPHGSCCPEGTEPRTIRAAVTCARDGHRPLRAARRARRGRRAGRGAGARPCPRGSRWSTRPRSRERYVDALVEARRHKGMTPDIARNQLDDTITLGTMMLRLDEVDGMVAGAVHTTAATLRPALQLLGTAPGRRAGVLGLLHVPARRGRDLRRLRGQPRPRRRAARRHRRAERRVGAALRHRAPGRDDQLQHRHVGRRAPTSSR